MHIISLACDWKIYLWWSQTSDVDDIITHVVFQNLECLTSRDTSRQKPKQVSSFDDDVRISRLLGRWNSHITFNQVELAGDAVFLESGLDSGPTLEKMLLSALRIHSGERADFEHTSRVPCRIELFLHCPTLQTTLHVWVNVPWLRLVVFT